MDVKNTNSGATVSIEPWLTVNAGEVAVNFYKAAFSAVETYRMKHPGGGLVVKLEVVGAGFWISAETAQENTPPGNDTAHPVKFILTVNDPDAVFAQAIKAGATEVFPVGEDYGWRLGRLTDPFGFDWEVGKQI